MTQRIPDNSNGMDDRAERLIVRALDGELTSAERIEFDGLIANSQAVAELYRSYRRMDALASEALHADFNGAFESPVCDVEAGSAAGHHWSRSVRVGLMTALLAAAAVVIVASLPFQWFDANLAQQGQATRAWPQHATHGPAAPMLVDYQRPVYQPQRLEGDVFRDVIGVQGDDPNVIIILERVTRQSRVETVSGDI